jgi:hypothetical protein
MIESSATPNYESHSRRGAGCDWLAPRCHKKAKPQVAGESAWGFYRLGGGVSGDGEPPSSIYCKDKSGK